MHRDLKPDNIMIVGSGNHQEIKIVDFGLSALVLIGHGYDPETSSKRKKYIHLLEPWGTPGYMAPEQDTRGYGPQVGEKNILFTVTNLCLCVCFQSSKNI